MDNAANTKQYKKRWEESQPLFVPANLGDEEKRQLTGGYTVQIQNYSGIVGKWNLDGSECRLLDSSGRPIAQWRSIDNSSDFHKILHHTNGRSYLIFRQDLYGYSLLDIAGREIRQFFPQHSLDGGETFIWTDADYCPETDVLAVSGCYWACPNSIQLFLFDDPFNNNLTFVDVNECFNGGYDDFEDVNFVGWNNSNLHVTRYVVASRSTEEVIIGKDEYLSWLSK